MRASIGFLAESGWGDEMIEDKGEGESEAMLIRENGVATWEKKPPFASLIA